MTLLHRPVSVIVTEDRLTVGSNNESKIIKLHGDFNHPDKMVITERDYDISRTVIRKSKAAIIEISYSSSNVMLELGLIKSTKQKQNILIFCEEGTSIPVLLIDQQVLTYTFDIAREKITYHFVKALREWSCRAFDIESIFCDNRGKHTTFADAYRLLDKGEYAVCIVSAYSELEYLISSHHTKDHDFANQILKFEKYLRSYVENDNYDAYELIELRNKIVHQRYVATEIEARDFLRLVEMVNADDFKTQG